MHLLLAVLFASATATAAPATAEEVHEFDVVRVVREDVVNGGTIDQPASHTMRFKVGFGADWAVGSMLFAGSTFPGKAMRVRRSSLTARTFTGS